MKFPLLTASLVLGLATVACTSSDNTVTQPESEASAMAATVVVNAQVYTVDSDRREVEAFAYDSSGVIIAVGSESDVRAAAGDDVNVIDVGGNMVLPGFQDAHVHVPEAGLNLEVCYFPRGRDIDAYESVAVECADDQADSDWVRGAGASLFDLRDTDESPLAVLDRAIPVRPAVVLDDLGHAIWTNSLGLAAAGIEPDDPDPQGGVFHRDGSGALTGLLLEDAQQLVRNAAAPDDETNYRGLLAAMDELASNGITTVSDAGGYWGQNHPAAWQRAEAEGTLTVRGMNSLYVYPNLDVDEQLAEFERRFSDSSDMLRFDTAKIYIDGILDLGTASLREPYDVPVDENYPQGFNYFISKDLTTYISELHTIGYRMNFHAIGDRSVSYTLDAIEGLDADPDVIADRRHRTTHTYLVHPDDVDRFAQIGMVVDFQQSNDAVAVSYHDYLSNFIGDRAYDLIPTAQLLETDATVILSSDWDAGPLPPLGTIERALTRDAHAVSDLETAIAMHTIDAAYALGHDDTTGSIEVGKFADYIILDQNLFELDLDQIDRTRTLYTVVAGTAVYQAPGFATSS